LSERDPILTHDSTPAPRTESVFLRIVWMMALPAILLCVFLLADQEKWTFGMYDFVLALLVFAAIGARAVDALYLGGTTAQGEPATRKHVVAYATRLLAITAVSWVFAQSVAI
jgi:hypothetical protein